MNSSRTFLLAAIGAAGLLGGPALAQAPDPDRPQFEAPVRLEADGAVIDTGADIGHAGPLFRDHDGDGLPDLLVSSFRGNIRFYRNIGTRSAPEFAARGLLEAGGEPIRLHNW